MKFSIRDLFLVMVIVALAVGWWLDHRRLTRNKCLDDSVFEIDLPRRVTFPKPVLKPKPLVSPDSPGTACEVCRDA